MNDRLGRHCRLPRISLLPPPFVVFVGSWKTFEDGSLGRFLPCTQFARKSCFMGVREELEGTFSVPSGRSLPVIGETSSPTSPGSVPRLSLLLSSPRARSAASPKQLMISMTSVRRRATPTRPSSGSRRPSVAAKASGSGSDVATRGVAASTCLNSLARTSSCS